MAERSAPTRTRLPSGLRRLVARTGELVGGRNGIPSRVGRLVAPLVGGLRGQSAVLLPDDSAVDYHSAVGARIGRGSVALSLEGGELRLLQHVGRRVVAWASVPLPAEAVRGGAVVDPPFLGETLADAFAQLRLPRRIVGAVSGLGASSLVLDLPWVKREEEIAEVVVDEANRAFGVTIDESHIMWQRLSGPRRERFVYALVVPREPLLAVVESYDVAGLQPEALDLKPLALARAVNQRQAIIADLEPDSLDVVIVLDDLPVYFRSSALPAGSLGREAVYDQLVAEVRRALASYEDAASGRVLDSGAAIYLCGSAVGSIALTERLRSQTGHPIGRATPPLYYPSDFPLAEQMVNVGLALKEL